MPSFIEPDLTLGEINVLKLDLIKGEFRKNEKYSSFMSVILSKNSYDMFMQKLYIIAICLFSLNSQANSRSIDRTWLGLFSKKSISELDYSFWAEGQARMDNDRFTNQQLLLRWGILKKISDKDEVGLLYGYIITDDVKENRPTIQYSRTFFENQKHALSLRNRLEYRKREDQKAISARFRTSIRYLKKIDPKFSLIVWDEPFLNLTNEEWTGNRLIERNRFFVGTGINLQETSLEIGYMHQFTPLHDRDTIDHILTLYFFY